jgi:hypothetical protein
MEFFIAHRTKEGTLRILPSFHFPTADKARDKVLELRRLIEVDLQVVKVSKRRGSASLRSAA